MNLSRRSLVITAIVYTLAVGIIHNPLGQPISAQTEVPGSDAIESITGLQILNDDPEEQEEQVQENQTPEIEGLLNVDDAVLDEVSEGDSNTNNGGNGNSGNNGNSNNGGNFNGGDGGFLNGNTILSNNGDNGGNGGNNDNGGNGNSGFL